MYIQNNYSKQRAEQIYNNVIEHRIPDHIVQSCSILCFFDQDPKYKNKPPGTQHDNVDMATMIQAVDDGVGEILAELEKLKLRENTVILFFSDNGGYGPATDMAPLKGYKNLKYEQFYILEYDKLMDFYVDGTYEKKKYEEGKWKFNGQCLEEFVKNLS